MGVVEILLQGTHILVASHLDDLVHGFAGGDGRGDESPSQAVTTDIEIVDGLAGAPLDHQVYPLGTEGFRHKLTPAVHATKQRPLADPAFFKPGVQRRDRAILLAGYEGYLGFMELMLARLESKPDPLPHKIEVADLDSGRLRAAQSPAEHQQQQSVIAQTGQTGSIDFIEYPGQGLQGQRPGLALAVIAKAHYAAHHLLDFGMFGRHGMDALLLEGVADPGQSPHQGRRFARLAVAQFPLALFLVQPDPVRQYAIGLICQKVHDVVMGGLQWIQPMQLAPEHEDTGVSLIGIEG